MLNTLKKAAVIGSVALFTLPTAALAHDSNSGHGDGDNDVKVEVKAADVHQDETAPAVTPTVTAEDVNEDAADVDEAEDVAVDNAEFKVEGMVAEVGDNFFTVTGFDHPIVLDPTMVEEFKVEGVLAVGVNVKVEGMVATDGTFFAEEVKVEAAH